MPSTTRRFATGSLAALTTAAGLLATPVLAGDAYAAAACSSETTPPVLTAFSFTPGSVDVRAGARTVSVTAEATDVGSGVESVQALFASPRSGGKQSFASATLELSGGTANEGRFTGKATVARWVLKGAWTVTGLYATDKAGNIDFLGYDQLGAKGWQRDLTVTSTPDVTAPKLTSLAMTPATVDTTAGPKKVKVTAKATDSQSGVSAVSVTFTRNGRKLQVAAGMKRVAGTPKSGTYAGYATVPRWVGKAGWSASAIVMDTAFNTRSYTTKALTSAHLPHAIAVVSKNDTTVPTATAESFTPTTVDVSNGPAAVDATVTAKDTLSGVASVAVTWTSPSQTDSATATLTRRAGTPLNGTWKGRATVDACSEAGVWTASAQLVDVAGNIRTLSTEALKAAGFATDLTVNGPDNTAPTASGPSGSVPGAGPWAITFSEPVKGISTAGFAAADSSSSPVAGSWACTGAGGAAVSCADGPVTAASFTPATALPAYSFVTFTPTAVTDLRGNALAYAVYVFTG